MLGEESDKLIGDEDNDNTGVDTNVNAVKDVIESTEEDNMKESVPDGNSLNEDICDAEVDIDDVEITGELGLIESEDSDCALKDASDDCSDVVDNGTIVCPDDGDDGDSASDDIIDALEYDDSCNEDADLIDESADIDDDGSNSVVDIIIDEMIEVMDGVGVCNGTELIDDVKVVLHSDGVGLSENESSELLKRTVIKVVR